MAERRDYDPVVAQLSARLAVVEEQCSQLRSRCDKKDVKIEVLQAFNNRAIGYAAAIAFIVSYVKDFFGH